MVVDCWVSIIKPGVPAIPETLRKDGGSGWCVFQNFKSVYSVFKGSVDICLSIMRMKIIARRNLGKYYQTHHMQKLILLFIWCFVHARHQAEHFMCASLINLSTTQIIKMMLNYDVPLSNPTREQLTRRLSLERNGVHGILVSLLGLQLFTGVKLSLHKGREIRGQRGTHNGRKPLTSMLGGECEKNWEKTWGAVWEALLSSGDRTGVDSPKASPIP